MDTLAIGCGAGFSGDRIDAAPPVVRTLVARGGPAALVTHCQEHLAGFKVPKHVFFRETLPKNPSGKILKRELRQQYQSAAQERPAAAGTA